MHINREALKAIRVRSSVSLAELARRTDIDRTLIGRIESGERKGTVEQRQALADGLGIPVGAITMLGDWLKQPKVAA